MPSARREHTASVEAFHESELLAFSRRIKRWQTRFAVPRRARWGARTGELADEGGKNSGSPPACLEQFPNFARSAVARAPARFTHLGSPARTIAPIASEARVRLSARRPHVAATKHDRSRNCRDGYTESY